MTGKGGKDVHKTKVVKSPSGEVQWQHETFSVSCSADTQFQMQVKNHATFGSSEDVGEALFFVDDSASAGEKTIKAGPGSVTIRSNFTPAPTNGVADSPKSVAGNRRSFLGKKEPRDTPERSSTPV